MLAVSASAESWHKILLKAQNVMMSVAESSQCRDMLPYAAAPCPDYGKLMDTQQAMAMHVFVVHGKC